MNKILLRTLKGENLFPRPIWFMRQAGRYLPEYKILREKAGSFLNLCFSPNLSTEVTLQPLKRFPKLDGAILFSDILVIPYALGYSVQFLEGEGPVLEKTEPGKEKPFVKKDFLERLLPIFETIKQTQSALSSDKTFLGFAGGPWTVLAYMIEGRGAFDTSRLKKTAFFNEMFIERSLKVLVEATILYLKEQIRAGVEAVQIFDSWAGILPESYFDRWVVNPLLNIVKTINMDYPSIPIILFPRGNPMFYKKFIPFYDFGCSLSIESTCGFSEINNAMPHGMTLQGGLDPSLLVVGGAAMIDETERILRAFSNRPYIFNLGHGITPDVPIDHVNELINFVKGWHP